MKLCVFPNDPIRSYYEKGEIKERYFNPNNIFDEIHVISFIDNDIQENKIQNIAGNAKLKIHSIGKIKIQNRKKYLKSIIELVREIDPDAIRTYNSRLEGWFAANCAKSLSKPLFVSIHTQYDHNRQLLKKSNFKKFLISKFMEKQIESFVLKNADKISIVYKVIEPYVKKHSNLVPELIYNKIDTERFSNVQKIDSLPKPLLLTVGNLIKEKNHECVIKAIKNLDINCLIIGKGDDKKRLEKIISENHLDKKIQFLESIPHTEIHNYFKSATIFALAYDPELEGLPMPVLEALSAGIPTVIPFPKKGFSDGLENSVLFVDRNIQGFHNGIKKILTDDKFRLNLSESATEKSKDFDIKKIEKQEQKIYENLISSNNNNHARN